MNVLNNIFNDENIICESLESFLKHFFHASILPYQTVKDIGELVLCYNKTICEQPKELHKCVLSWDEFQEFIVFHFIKQDPQHHNNCSNLKSHYLSTSIESLLKKQAWKHLYEFVGTELMRIILTKCYINIGLGNNSYLCLNTKEIKEIYRKCDENSKETICFNRNFGNIGSVITAKRKPLTSGYKGNMQLSLRDGMYKANAFPYWPVSHILSRSNLKSIIVSNIVDDILQEDVGVDLSSTDIQVIKHKLNTLKNLLTYLVQKHKNKAPYSALLRSVVCRKIPSKNVIQVPRGRKSSDCIRFKEIMSTNKESLNYNEAMNTDNMEHMNRKRKLVVCIDGFDHFGVESGHSSNKNSSLIIKCNKQVIKKVKLDSTFDVTECGDHLEVSDQLMNVHVQTKEAHYKRQSTDITLCDKLMLVFEKRKKKFLKLKPLPVHIVKEFLFTALRQILHKKVFAIEKNWTEFCNFIKKILTLGKDCLILLKDVSNSIDSKCIKWVMDVPSQFRQTILAKFLKWIWNKIVVCIVAANFYVTEFSHCKNKIVFYEKRVWRSLEDTAFSHLLRDRKIKPISKPLWENYCKIKNSGKLRILPKVDGARPILILKKTKEDYMLLISKVFLQQLNKHSRTSIHSTNVNELSAMWKQIVTHWKNTHKPKLYFVGVDIRDAYGSIILDKLMKIVKANTKLTLGKQKSMVFKRLTCLKVKKGQLQWSSVAYFESLPFVPPRNCMLFDSGEDKEFSVKKILTAIRNTVKCQTIERGKKTFLICQGIAQGGSPLSQALCDIYYSALDKTHLNIFRSDENDFLIRSVDDYLYITPDVSRAENFKEVMHKGFPDFGVFINPKKTKCNLNSEIQTFLFCGYAVDCSTLEVRPSFSCYTGVEIQHTIMFNSANNPGRFLETKMAQLNAVKLNKFTLDLEYNSALTVYCNVYEASVLMACRFITIIMKLFEEINSEFLINQICRSASLVVRTVRKLSCASGETSIDFNGVLWIVYRAFHVSLKKRVGTFYEVLKSLYPLMYSVQAKIGVNSHETLKHATNVKQLPQELKHILNS